jgi:hypothetical protein
MMTMTWTHQNFRNDKGGHHEAITYWILVVIIGGHELQVELGSTLQKGWDGRHFWNPIRVYKTL